ncbi:2-amino-3-ketobutyrate coenzyme A ligase [Firmicutes bacterium CAG:170]|jgi:glycine C-acetyltransferase|nr:glycine C-acetyltransferase [Oscillospiraceae bacterium]CDB87262.1 2-amino-3-ketobutyrate coenzyme A ligase [Firmicutes bacterium CAG:170]
MKTALKAFEQELDAIREAGTWREERIITTPQYSRIDTTAKKGVVNLCANNYLGLSTHPALIEAAKESYDRWGFGLSSVRFICGTQEIHKELERRIANFVGTDDAILYSSCFDANGGLFETLLGPEDAVISDELNHASIIDGVRLCKAKRFRYKNNNMDDLRAQLEAARAAGCKKILIATDGVFSMDGYIANLKAICDLADEFDALTMVDDSHAVGFMGEHGRGTAEYCGVMGRVDIITGTFGKAMGGASGGYTAARQPIVDLLRQRSRPYLFSNTLAPAICAATLRTIDLLEQSTELRDRVHANARYFRAEMEKHGFDLLPGEHPIVPVMLYDPRTAQEFARRMLEKGVYVVGFCYPVVPKGRDRIRTQISAGHTKEDLDLAVRCFAEVKQEMGL